MSGGSYDYLFIATSLSELVEKRRALQEMADRLADLDERDFPGVTAAATMTRRLDLLLQTWDVHVAAQVGLLARVWKAVEWWDSCDSGPDGVRDELAALLAPPPPGDV